jgi:(+)-trans-carveol dehydrogenase
VSWEKATTGRVAGKVAFITGAARGQGRSHAIRLAEEGADIIALDICRQIDTVRYEMGTAEELAETVAAVEKLGRRAIAIEADVRDRAAMERGLDDAVAQLGRLDIVCANAAIVTWDLYDEIADEEWRDIIDVCLTGVWNTARASIKHLAATGPGGSMIFTSSVAGLKGMPIIAHYSAAKHGVIGLMRTLAREFGPRYGVRVNAVLPTTVRTPMVENVPFMRVLFPDVENPSADLIATRSTNSGNPLGIPFVESIDISNAVLFLASDEARYVNAVALPVDGGMLAE